MTINAIYLYGSHVYESSTPKSDVDVIAIVDEKNKDSETDIKKIVLKKLKIKNFSYIDVNVFTESEFLKALENMEISFIECLSIDTNCLHSIKKYTIPTIHVPTLIDNISKKSSNSWDKTNKKLSQEYNFNPYVAKKSLWHSFRMIIFAQQIAQHSKIIDFSQANYLLPEILALKTPLDHKEGLLLWKEIDIKYSPILTDLIKQLKLLDLQK